MYATEVRPISELEIAPAEVKPAELNLARQLIEQGASDKFDPSAYTDQVRTRIEAAVQRKVEGHEISRAEPPVEGGAQVIDLMEALRASLGKKAPAAAEPEAAPARKPAKRAQQEEPEAAPAKKTAKKK
jgi:DNA end-binding protein Ku